MVVVKGEGGGAVMPLKSFSSVPFTTAGHSEEKARKKREKGRRENRRKNEKKKKKRTKNERKRVKSGEAGEARGNGSSMCN